MKMKKLMMALAGSMTLGCEAQVLFETPDLYDTGMMNMYINAARETARARLDNFIYYYGKAVDAFNDNNWNYVIFYANKALATYFEDARLYYMRGVARYHSGQTREAKKDLKKALKQGYQEAKNVLDYLKIREKLRK